MILQFILENLAAILTACVGIYLAVATRKKTESETAATLVRAAKEMTELHNSEIDDLKDSESFLKEYIEYLLNGMEKLTNQIKRKKFKPSFRPVSLEKFMKNPPK
jgi:NurA-like 5'-3' nuclease